MMRLVVDASVAVKWLIAEDDSNIARTMAAKGEDLHAPRLMASRDCQCAVAQGAAGRDRPRRRGGHAGFGTGDAGTMGERRIGVRRRGSPRPGP